MKKLITLVVLTSCPLYAATYLYRVPTTELKATLLNDVASVDTKNEGQPYVDTYVLPQGDTNYVLLKMTPADGQDPQIEKTYVNLDLYKVQDIGDDGFFYDIVDNSKTFPVDTRWDLMVSSKQAVAK